MKYDENGKNPRKKKRMIKSKTAIKRKTCGEKGMTKKEEWMKWKESNKKGARDEERRAW